MPLYEFTCQNEKCGHMTERRQPIADATKVVQCPKCGSDALKVWSVPSEPRIPGGTPKFH